MFCHNTLEATTNRVKIVDSDYETMQELLRFIYCEKVLDLKKVALTLLPATNKVIGKVGITYKQGRLEACSTCSKHTGAEGAATVKKAPQAKIFH
jgi:hypothetical protein